ncbi:hypothetical protein SAMN05421505_111141 [Sinosporangium album]|uniref:Uncharacterized protein n=1 Tax=Sinosporangium album TaxID=504805 RepID=A0A1G7ZP10_9ACTN|nr:hypothetical protein [Sinosporangium album]SDH10502.1 hypothetical protein SAMN05421505_111141 [Sinosporangium album]
MIRRPHRPTGPALAAAAFAVPQAGLHLLLIGSLAGPAGAAMAVLALACALCAIDLWRRPRLRAWAMMLVLSVAMIAVHLFPGFLGHGAETAHGPHEAGVGHHAGHSVAEGSLSLSGFAMNAALWFSFAETILAAAVLLGAARHRIPWFAPRRSGTCP